MGGVNEGLEDLEGRVRLKMIWKFIPLMGKHEEQKLMEVSSDPGLM